MISTFHTDHIFIAYCPDFPTAPNQRCHVLQALPTRHRYHRDVQRLLWPLDSSSDSECWWTSQWGQTVVAALTYPGRILANPRLEVVNAISRPYPRRQLACEKAFCEATKTILERMPVNTLSSFRPHPWFLNKVAAPDSPVKGAQSRCVDQLASLIQSRLAMTGKFSFAYDDCYPAEHLCVFGDALQVK
jgi:hypothetical protein